MPVDLYYTQQVRGFQQENIKYSKVRSVYLQYQRVFPFLRIIKPSASLLIF